MPLTKEEFTKGRRVWKAEITFGPDDADVLRVVEFEVTKAGQYRGQVAAVASGGRLGYREAGQTHTLCRRFHATQAEAVAALRRRLGHDLDAAQRAMIEANKQIALVDEWRAP